MISTQAWAFTGDQAEISVRSIRLTEEAPEGGGVRGGKGEGRVRGKKFLPTS